ncbi:DMT family transporter [Deinococcus sp. QL22]|uniref:DMT family transporter n=1 Tax=Deinococcus sp. QL22 TaxID=2939437 RepID=UPI002017FC73|nr:EamA family transporter [Deinococcus sp. QL22]UQN08463.1 EamA family transporter [Deinococcus sp. QL22]
MTTSAALPILALALANGLWGTTFLLGKVTLDVLPVAHVVLLRFTFAALTLLPFALAKLRFPQRRDVPLFVLTGLLQVPATYLLQVGGLAHTSASSAALILGVLAPLLALGAWRFAGERLSRLGWAAIATSTLGVALIVGSPGPGRTVLGDSLVFASTFAAVGGLLLSQRLVRSYGPVITAAWTLTAGTFLTFPFALLSGRLDLHLAPTVWAALAGLGIGCTALTLVLWNWGVSRTSASFAGVFVNLEPLVGALLGVLVLHERPGALTLLGGGLILGAAVLVTRWGTSAHPQTVPKRTPSGSTRPRASTTLIARAEPTPSTSLGDHDD